MDMDSQVSLPGWACPTHRASLDQQSDELRCPSGCHFPIVNGIARFVASPQYASAFGLQWRKYRRTQLDSYMGVPLTELRLRRCLGEKLWDSLQGSTVLEVGCGAGRFTEVLLKEGALVTSVDLSDAVEANQESFPQGPHHVIGQADVYALPFQSAQFDIVLCLGVIQHTPEPEKTFKALWHHVRPGGWLVVDHYTYNLSHFTKTAPLFRQVLKRLKPESGLRATTALVNALFPVHKAVRAVYPLQMLLSRISPVQVYFHAHPALSMELQREWALLDTHDTLTDWHKHFRTRRQIARILVNLNGVRIHCVNGGNGVEARAQK
jgi:2-polyprenyl-3-methyl-5-hydroxy-6-metoxy-1,4-benzoquinol methylase